MKDVLRAALILGSFGFVASARAETRLSLGGSQMDVKNVRGGYFSLMTTGKDPITPIFGVDLAFYHGGETREAYFGSLKFGLQVNLLATSLSYDIGPGIGTFRDSEVGYNHGRLQFIQGLTVSLRPLYFLSPPAEFDLFVRVATNTDRSFLTLMHTHQNAPNIPTAAVTAGASVLFGSTGIFGAGGGKGR